MVKSGGLDFFGQAMAEITILESKSRQVTGKRVEQLRRAGEMPGVVYGHNFPNRLISVRAQDFEKVYRLAGTSSLVDLVIDGEKPIKVLLHEPQRHPVRPTPLHADFYVVKMSEKLETAIPLHFVGEAHAVTILDGTLSPHLDALNVTCYPDQLVPAIEVDLTPLKTFEAIIRVADLILPEGIEILDDPEEVIATVTPPRTEEELAELEAAPAGEEADQAAVEALEVGEEKEKEEEAPLPEEETKEETKET